MSTDVLERPVEESALAEGDDDIYHWVCHCTKDQVAGCGRYVGDLPLGGEREWSWLWRGADCEECVDSWPDDACPWGCTCPEECKLADDDDEFRGQRASCVILDEAAGWSSEEH